MPTGTNRNRLPDDLGLRELAVAALVADGLTDNEIASRLVLSPHTVKAHVGNILRKLNARSRSQAVAILCRRGLLKDTTTTLKAAV